MCCRQMCIRDRFCKEHSPGHQALVCTHPDGHNHSGNIHVHIVINSLRIYEVPLLPYMDRPADTREGCCLLYTSTMYDELQLDTLGDKKTALFLIMSDTDSTFNFLISMVYTCLLYTSSTRS